MITRMDPDHTLQAIDDSSRPRRTREPNQTSSTGDTVSISTDGRTLSRMAQARGYFADADNGFSKLSDYTELLSLDVSDVKDIGDLATELSPEKNAAFLEALSTFDPAEEAPGLIYNGTELGDDNFFALTPDLYLNHEGETYNFITRKWSSEE